MSQLWASSCVIPNAPTDVASVDGRVVDVGVVGAGITGLTTAVLRARAGKSVPVVEARTVGAGTTGNTFRSTPPPGRFAGPRTPRARS